MGCTSSRDVGGTANSPEELKRSQQMQRMISTRLREDRMGAISKGMPRLEKRLSCELGDSEAATSPQAQEEKDALLQSRAATLAQKQKKRKTAMVNAIRENKWMIFSSLDTHEDADMAALATFMAAASKSLKRLHDAKYPPSPRASSKSPASAQKEQEYFSDALKRAESYESLRQSKKMLEQNFTDDVDAAGGAMPPPPPLRGNDDDDIVLKKKLSSRSINKISMERVDSSESIINITRKNSSRISIGSTGSSSANLQEAINAAMESTPDDDSNDIIVIRQGGQAASPSSLSSKSVQSSLDTTSKKTNLGLLSLTSNVLGCDDDINNFDIPPGFISMEGVRAIISCYRKNGKLSDRSLHKVLRLGYKSLKNLPNTTHVAVGLSDRLTVVGDIHGQIWDLIHILDESGLPSPTNKYIFNGDFVDRGPCGVEVMCVLLAMHAAMPDSVHLNRGNHEDFAICTVYGFQNECINKYDEVAFGMFCEIFNHLPLFAIIQSAVFVLHGGLFHSTDASLAELDSINRCNFSLGELAPDTDSLDHIPRYRQDDYLKQLVRDALWSDPMTEGGLGFNPRGAGVAFGPDIAKAFLKNNNLKMVVRSHECIRTGFDLPYLGDEKDLLCTVFSASNYCGGDNSAAYMVFTHQDYNNMSAGNITSSSSHNTIASNVEDAIPVPVIDTYLVYRIYYYNINSLKEDEVAAELNCQLSASRSSSETSVDMSFYDLILRKKAVLLEEFRAVDAATNRGTKLGAVSSTQWANTMQQVCKLQISWVMMIAELVPDHCIRGDSIDYVAFLKSFSDTQPSSPTAAASADATSAAASGHDASLLTNSVIEALYTQHNKLDAVFRFFDQDCDGVISKEEFVDGCEILNSVLDDSEKITNFERLLLLLDIDESGCVHINEFFEMCRLSEAHSGREGRPEIASLPVIGSSQQRLGLGLGGSAIPRISSHRMLLTEAYANNTAGPTTINTGDLQSGKIMTINIDESPLLSPTVGKSEKRGHSSSIDLGYDYDI